MAARSQVCLPVRLALLLLLSAVAAVRAQTDCTEVPNFSALSGITSLAPFSHNCGQSQGTVYLSFCSPLVGYCSASSVRL